MLTLALCQLITRTLTSYRYSLSRTLRLASTPAPVPQRERISKRCLSAL